MSKPAQRDATAERNRAGPRERMPVDVERSANCLAVIPSTAAANRFDTWHGGDTPNVRRQAASARSHPWSTGVEYVLVLFF